MTFVPVNIKKIENAQKEEEISKWTTKEGWIFPHIKTSIESNEHPQKPDPARLDEISQVNYFLIFKLNKKRILLKLINYSLGLKTSICIHIK